ncbi:hypothetical protein DSO57_1017820 [Entomophthora muscae]|uniref:Uncharacterized protein n=1 Tax=Entomophthora muscae TaxID=34485 RepID=A0ACC2SHD2_9FUNG|nr:hypothetical protein DSO57_1017820 [Entomophthora muscae]
MLTDQVATLRGKIEYLRQHLSDPDDLSFESDGKRETEVAGTPPHLDHGCCPGLEGQPCVNCALALDHLAAVRNIPDINQILTEEKCWKQIMECPSRHPPYLPAPSASLPAPASKPSADPPACPPILRCPASHPQAQAGTSRPAASPQATCLLPGPQPTASHPPGPHSSFPSQSGATMPDNQWDLEDHSTYLSLDPSQTGLPNPKIDLGSPKSCSHHLTICPEEIIGSRQNCLKPQKIAQEQKFGHLLKPHFPKPFSKLLGSPVPCFYSHLQNFASGGTLQIKDLFSVIACAIIEINTLNKVKFNLQLKVKLPISPCQPSSPRKMNHLIFTAELTACLGIGGYQQGSEFFGPSPDRLVHDPHYNPGQLNSSQTGPWPPLVSPHSTLSIAIYTSMYYILTYFAGSFGR